MQAFTLLLQLPHAQDDYKINFTQSRHDTVMPAKTDGNHIADASNKLAEAVVQCHAVLT